MAAARHSMCSTAILPDKNLLFCKVNANRAQDKINGDLFLRSEDSVVLRKTTLYEAEEKQVYAYFSCRGAA